MHVKKTDLDLFKLMLDLKEKYKFFWIAVIKLCPRVTNSTLSENNNTVHFYEHKKLPHLAACCLWTEKEATKTRSPVTAAAVCLCIKLSDCETTSRG